MKKRFIISLNLVLLVFFTLTSKTVMWACDKSKPYNEEQQHAASKCPKACCQKKDSSSSANCQSACCAKHSTHSKKTKKGCCGDGDCSCSISTTVSVDLLQFSFPDISIQFPVLNRKNIFSYKQVFTKSSVHAIWQPPISTHSI